jgi:hypothetical protein
MAMVFVELSIEETAMAKELADATYERHRHQSGQYRNLQRSHLVGKLGEVAVDKWLRQDGFATDPAYRDPERERDPDVLVNGRGIAVKSWRPDTWGEWGRCVTPGQMPGLQKKVLAIVWAVVDDERIPCQVEIAGWSTPDEVAAQEPQATGPAYRPVVNHQVTVEQLREPRTLFELLRS